MQMGHGGVQELPIKSNKANTNINDKKQTPGSKFYAITLF